MWSLCGNYCRGRTDKARSCLVRIPNQLRPWLLCLMLRIPVIMKEQELSKTEKSFWEAPVFLHNSFSHKMVVERLEKAARKIHIKYQWENGCGRTCTDADAIHMAGRGIPTTVMSIPLRYMHNPAEVCSMEDVQGCIDVLAEFFMWNRV